MIQPTDIHSITDFRRDSDLSTRIAQDGRPHVLTEAGRPKLVVQDAAAYEKLVKALERAEALQGIRRGLAALDAGDHVSLADFDAEMRKRHPEVGKGE
jgi:prevent-host-death family protein